MVDSLLQHVTKNPGDYIRREITRLLTKLGMKLTATNPTTITFTEEKSGTTMHITIYAVIDINALILTIQTQENIGSQFS